MNVEVKSRVPIPSPKKNVYCVFFSVVCYIIQYTIIYIYKCNNCIFEYIDMVYITPNYKQFSFLFFFWKSIRYVYLLYSIYLCCENKNTWYKEPTRICMVTQPKRPSCYIYTIICIMYSCIISMRGVIVCILQCYMCINSGFRVTHRKVWKNNQ